jgi:hypothetical protein
MAQATRAVLFAKATAATSRGFRLSSDDHTLWFQKFHHIIMGSTSRRLLGYRTASRYRALRLGETLYSFQKYCRTNSMRCKKYRDASNLLISDLQRCAAFTEAGKILYPHIPLYPKKRTLYSNRGMSAWCQKSTSTFNFNSPNIVFRYAQATGKTLLAIPMPKVRARWPELGATHPPRLIRFHEHLLSHRSRHVRIPAC